MKFVQTEEVDLLTLYKPVNKNISAYLSSPANKLTALYEAIRLDPALSLLIIRSANSKVTGLYNSVSSLKLALNILGKDKVCFLNNTVKNFASENILNSIITISNYWRHSLAVALISETIAKHIKRFSPINPENLFCAGLFHDLGIIAMAKKNSVLLEDVIKKSLENEIPLIIAETDKKHAEVGAEILRTWGVPEKIYGPIWYHHNPSATPKFALYAAVIHVADVTAQLIGMPLFEGEKVPQIDEDALKLLGLSPERLNVIARDAMDFIIKMEKEF